MRLANIKIHHFVTVYGARSLATLAMLGGGIAVLKNVRSHQINYVFSEYISWSYDLYSVFSAAKSEFIKSASHYPLEPPLRIWRGLAIALHQQPQRTRNIPVILEAVFRSAISCPSQSGGVGGRFLSTAGVTQTISALRGLATKRRRAARETRNNCDGHLLA